MYALKYVPVVVATTSSLPPAVFGMAALDPPNTVDIEISDDIRCSNGIVRWRSRRTRQSILPRGRERIDSFTSGVYGKTAGK